MLIRMSDQVPIPLALVEAFSYRPLRPLEDTARLLGMSGKTLRRHVAAGNIRPVNLGVGAVKRRLAFRLSDVSEFLQHQHQSAPCQSTKRAPARPNTASTSNGKVVGFLARRAALISERQRPSSAVKSSA